MMKNHTPVSYTHLQLKDLLDGAESTDAFLVTLQKLRKEHIEQYQ